MIEELERRIDWHLKMFGKKPEKMFLTQEEYPSFELAVLKKVCSVQDIELKVSVARFQGVEISGPPHEVKWDRSTDIGFAINNKKDYR